MDNIDTFMWYTCAFTIKYCVSFKYSLYFPMKDSDKALLAILALIVLPRNVLFSLL